MERLYKLARKGYKPDFDMEFTKSISLRHSSLKIRWPHDKLICFPTVCSFHCTTLISTVLQHGTRRSLSSFSKCIETHALR